MFARKLTKAEKEIFFFQTLFELFSALFILPLCCQKNFVFLHFWILHVCQTPKGIGQYSKKYKNLILEGIHLLFTANVWIKKSLKDEYPKILLGIICYYSLLIFG
jgi:hypothetical protein